MSEQELEDAFRNLLIELSWTDDLKKASEILEDIEDHYDNLNT